MRLLAILGAASTLVLTGASAGRAATLCVDPDEVDCFATIQEAVDAAISGDIVSIRPKADGSAYNEAVTIETPNLTIAGEGGPTFRSVAEMIEFSPLATVDLDDPDVALWLDNYPAAQDFLDALATLEDFIAEETLIEQCPAVVVEVCDTPPTDPGLCGNNSELDVNVFSVAASGTSFADLTLRHGAAGIFLAEGVTDTTVERVCFRANDVAVTSDFESASGTEIRQSFVDGPAINDSFEISGDDIVIERNLLLNVSGITVSGDGYQVLRNAVAVTTQADCIRAQGPNGLVSTNVAMSCGDGLGLDNDVDVTVTGNLFQGTFDGDNGMFNFVGIPGTNLRAAVKHNIVRLTSGDGIGLLTNDGVIEGNLIERTGTDEVAAGGLRVFGSDNQILHNLIRFSSRSAITVGGFFGGDGFVPASGNLIQGNLLTRNHTSGVHLQAGSEFIGGPQVLDTTIDGNIITLNDGEGVAIPQGFEDPPNEPAASGTVITNNTFRNNQIDICDESDSTTIGGGNGSPTVAAECVVEAGVATF